MSVWTEEKVAELRRLWAAGSHNTVEIGNLMGVSKSTVICKLHREGLQGQKGVADPVYRESKYNRRSSEEGKPRKPRKSKPRTAMTGPKPTRARCAPEPQDDFVLPDAVAFGAEAVIALQDRSCKWPVGDPRTHEFRFCGDDKMPGSSYCSHHHGLAYNKARKTG